LRIARTRKKVFCRDNEEVSAAGQGSGAADPGLRFARAQCPAGGASGRGIGPGGRVSPQTVSRITQEMDQAVKQFHIIERCFVKIRHRTGPWFAL